MKLSSVFPIAVLALALTTASAQTPSAAPAAAHNPKPYRVTYTLTEMDGAKTIGVQHYSVIVVEGGRTTLKNGSKIPVATGSYSGGGAGSSVQTQFTYLDVGINIDTTLVDQVDGMWRLKSKFEQSSVAEKPVTISGVEEPIVRQSVMEMSTSVTVGKPQVLGTLDFTGTTRRLEIEVMLEPVK
jgi:type II secretory pathway component GspD/PulD (secretin)